MALGRFIGIAVALAIGALVFIWQARQASSRRPAALSESYRVISANPSNIAFVLPGIQGEIRATLRLAAGTYTLPFKFKGLKKLRIEADGEVIFDLGQKPETLPLDWSCDIYSKQAKPCFRYPQNHLQAAMLFEESENIEVNGMTFRNVWPTAIGILNSKQIKIKNLDLVGGTFAVFAEGELTRGIEISESRWNQDSSGKIYDSWSWQEVHHGAKFFFNGAFFGSRDIQGHVQIGPDNLIENAFNAIRMNITGAGKVLCRNEGVTCILNTDVKIFKNKFVRIADNAIEPEVYAKNWIVSDNEFEDIHAPMSFDDVGGSGFLIEQNRFWNHRSARTLLLFPNDVDPHRGGKFFKFGYASGPTTLSGMVVRGNSIITRYQNGLGAKQVYKGDPPPDIKWLQNRVDVCPGQIPCI